MRLIADAKVGKGAWAGIAIDGSERQLWDRERPTGGQKIVNSAHLGCWLALGLFDPPFEFRGFARDGTLRLSVAPGEFQKPLPSLCRALFADLTATAAWGGERSFAVTHRSDGVRRRAEPRGPAHSSHSPDASPIVPMDNLWVGRVDRGMICVKGRSRRGPANERDARQHANRFRAAHS